jgi:ElaB/YqjD/DUF883 family membrane-anchored ribosome-binding protein
MVQASKLMDSAMHTARDSMHIIRDVASHKLHDFSEAASEKMHHMGERASEYAHLGKEKARDMARCTADMVRERPVQSTLIALGLGCLMAAFFVRR